jgi:hypothetical protein
MAEPERLHPDEIEAIAVRVAALLKGERGRPSIVAKEYLTTREIAERYGVSTDSCTTTRPNSRPSQSATARGPACGFRRSRSSGS